MDQLPTFKEICSAYSIDPLQLVSAGLPNDIVARLFLEQDVSELFAGKALDILSALTGKKWMVENIYVPLAIDVENIKSEVTRTLHKIRLEEISSQRGLNGLSEQARHSRRTVALENIARHVNDLGKRTQDKDSILRLLFDQWGGDDNNPMAAK